MAEKKLKKDKLEVAEEVQTKPNASAKPAANSWGGKLVWGTLFIVIGVLLLLANLEIITIKLANLWQLWPVLIVVAGLSILSLRGWLGKIVYVLAAVAIAVLAWVTVTGGVGDERIQATGEFRVGASGREVQELRLDVVSGAGSIDIDSEDGQNLVRGSFNSEVAKLKQNVKVEDGKQEVELVLDRQSNWLRGGKNPLTLHLGRRLPLDLRLDAGASSIDADLSEVKLRSLEIDSGASSIDVKLGSQLERSKVLIDTGVSSVKLQVPKEVGVSLKMDSGLSSRKLPADFSDAENGVYRSANYDKATHKIDIEVDMGVSSFELRNY